MKQRQLPARFSWGTCDPMKRRANFKQADATRALRAAVAAGLKPSGFKIDANGAIVVMFGDDPIEARNSFDSLMGKAA